MDKKTQLWTVNKLSANFPAISFPEYQREPTVWALDAKQRLIDSMMRKFDIASLYLYVHDDDFIECIDGRQRINAIMSFLEENPGDPSNGFQFRILNEVFPDTDHPFAELDKRSYNQITELGAAGSSVATRFLKAFLAYELTVVFLKGSRAPEEFNLQFTRLNLGTIINSGEKLHAMVGELRDVVFDDIGKHPFFKRTKIPTRRYANQQVAAQLLVQVISRFKKGEESEYTRTRHFDLQTAFKEGLTLKSEERALVDKTRKTLDLLAAAFDTSNPLRNRAITVSVVLLALELDINSKKAAEELARFINGFVCRLQWQIKKGVDIDDEYRHLLRFQRHLTQASVEKPAVKERAEILRSEFDLWRKTGAYTGDAEYKKRTGEDPSEVCAAGQ